MINPQMRMSPTGLALAKDFEKCVLKPYQDSKGVWTDGWGNTHGVVPNGPAISQMKADAQFVLNISTAVNAVNKGVNVEITQDEFDALVDLTFNIGAEAFLNSTLLKILNQGCYHQAASHFEEWDMSGGKHLPGLLRRRVAEEFLFNSDTPGETT